MHGEFHETIADETSGALSLDMIPMLIQTGSRAICVQFDVWGFTRLIADSLKTARDHASSFKGMKLGEKVANGQPKPE
jgi:4-hydroxy-2-oxoheptanedioate aldolase